MLKLIRAHQHLIALKAGIQRFEEGNPAVIVAEFEPNRPGHDIRYIVRKPIPARFGPMIGDVIYNLRAALDYAVYELTIAHTGHPLEGTAFPVCRTRQAWGQLDGRTGSPAGNTGLYKVRGVSREARAVIKRLQPFHRKKYRKHPVWMLDELCNLDKHRSLHVTTLLPGRGNVSLTLRNGATLTRQRFLRKPPEHDTVFGWLSYSKGTTEDQVDMKITVPSKVVFQEIYIGNKAFSVVDFLEMMDEDVVSEILAHLSVLVPDLT